jgi:hypothetical protein
MSETYRDNVERKIVELRPVAAEIHGHLLTMCKGQNGYTISTHFREKNKIRIAEKDVNDYDGLESSQTKVKDIFAARLCPLSSACSNEEEVTQEKEKIRNILWNYFENYPQYKCVMAPKTLTIEGTKMKIPYITFLNHIELQVVTMTEFRLLEDTHGSYEVRRAGLEVIPTLNAHASHSSLAIPKSAVKSTPSVIEPVKYSKEETDLNASFHGYMLTFDFDITMNCKHFIPGSREWMHKVRLEFSI